MYHTAHGADDFGKQKHPVQLNGLAYFPVESGPLPPERRAYEMRHDITDRAKEPFFFGWTLGEFLLAGSNLKRAEGWRHDWDKIRESDNTDARWGQFYETSGEREKPFYMATHGMVLQSLIRNYVNDYWGSLDLASCSVFEGPVSFGNITTRHGVTVSGTVKDQRAELDLKALKDCCFLLNDSPVSMKRGETKTVCLQL